MSLFGSCGDDPPLVTCELSFEGQAATVQLPGTTGASAFAQVGDYRVDFSVLAGLRMHSVVTRTSSGEHVMSSDAGGLGGGGSVGGLSYVCRV